MIDERKRKEQESAEAISGLKILNVNPSTAKKLFVIFQKSGVVYIPMLYNSL